jgi:hypothetical protein
MKPNLIDLKTTIPLVVVIVATSTSLANAATIGSSISFSGYAFGSSTQMDYVNSSTLPLTPSPNVNGSFKVVDASGSFTPALTFPPQSGTLRDFIEGNSPSGVIVQTGPVLNGSNNPIFYVPDFISVNVPGSVNFTFRLETANRTVAFDPNSDPSDPMISKMSVTLTGTLTDLLNNEVQAAVGTFNPNIPPNVKLSQFTPTDFLGPGSFNGSLQVVSAPTPQAVPEPTTNASGALFGVFAVGYAVNKRKKLTQVKLPGSKS